jgi:hypothetical protein
MQISVTAKNRFDDGQVGFARDVANGYVQANIHQPKGFLHFVDIGSLLFDQVLTMIVVGMKLLERITQQKTTRQQAQGVEPLNPQTINDIGFGAARAAPLAHF